MKKIYYKLREIMKRGLDASRAYSIKEGARMDRECEETRLFMIKRMEGERGLRREQRAKEESILTIWDII